MEPYLQIKSPPLIWRWGTCKFHLQVPHLQISASDLITSQGTRTVVPALATRVICPIPILTQVDVEAKQMTQQATGQQGQDAGEGHKTEPDFLGHGLVKCLKVHWKVEKEGLAKPTLSFLHPYKTRLSFKHFDGRVWMSNYNSRESMGCNYISILSFCLTLWSLFCFRSIGCGI